MVYLQTFGRLALQNSSFGGTKALVLTAYLALEGPKPRAELAALLYGKQTANARDKLYALVNYLEKRTAGVIERDPERLRTRVPNDIHDLLNVLRAEALEGVDTLYQGYFLEGVQLDAFSSELGAWVLTQRAFFASQVREAFLKLGERAATTSFEAGARRAERAYLLHWAPEPDDEVFRRVYTLLAAGDHPLAATVQKEARTFGVTLELTQAQARQHLRPRSTSVETPVSKVKAEEDRHQKDQVPTGWGDGEGISQRDRRLLLQRVRTLWLDGVLTNMVDVPLELERDLRPDVVARPWGGRVERPYMGANLAEQPLSTAYEAAGRTLLLLGDAGAGKTVSLLQLTQSLLNGAEADPTEPLPIIFKLGGWAGPLFDWLVRELETWYYIPAELGQGWLKGRQLVLLLDGLDEVSPSKRRGCIDAINTFTAAYGPPGFVVTSRTEAYLQTEGCLRLQAALELKPLTDDQVDDYLTRTRCGRTDGPLSADPYLRLLARNPAMLKVIDMASLAQDEDSWMRSAPSAPKTAHAHVLHSYIQKTLFRKDDEARYADDDTLDWLGWLAHHMKRRGRSVLRLEDLQPDWLGESRRRCYHCAAGFLWGLLHAAIAAFSASFVVGVPGNLLIGLTVGVFVGVREAQERRYTRLEAMNRPRWSWRGVAQTTWRFWLRWLAITGVLGLLLTLSGGALLGSSPRQLGEWLETLLGSVMFSVPFGLLVGLLEAGLRNQQLALTSGFNRTVPASARYMLLGSLTFAGLGALVLSPGFAYLLAAAGLSTGPALAAGTFIGLSLGFWQFGGMTFIGYYVLRTVLALGNRTTRNPFDYPNFLAYASSLTFLREVGGGYEFFHGIVQDYFAARHDEKNEDIRERRYVETL